MPNPNIIVTDELHIDALEAETGRLPKYLVDTVATKVVRTLVRAGIDPTTVYFRGRTGATAEDARRAYEDILRIESYGSVNDYGTSHDDIIAERQRRQDPYGHILGEAAARERAAEAALGRQIDGPPNPIYTLATLDGLLNPDSDNPLYDAGVEEADPDNPDTGSFLDVYDATLVRGFEPGFLDVEGNEVPVRSVSIPEEQLSLAALAVVQLNYRIVNEGE